MPTIGDPSNYLRQLQDGTQSGYMNPYADPSFGQDALPYGGEDWQSILSSLSGPQSLSYLSSLANPSGAPKQGSPEFNALFGPYPALGQDQLANLSPSQLQFYNQLSPQEKSLIKGINPDTSPDKSQGGTIDWGYGGFSQAGVHKAWGDKYGLFPGFGANTTNGMAGKDQFQKAFDDPLFKLMSQDQQAGALTGIDQAQGGTGFTSDGPSVWTGLGRGALTAGSVAGLGSLAGYFGAGAAAAGGGGGAGVGAATGGTGGATAAGAGSGIGAGGGAVGSGLGGTVAAGPTVIGGGAGIGGAGASLGTGIAAGIGAGMLNPGTSTTPPEVTVTGNQPSTSGDGFANALKGLGTGAGVGAGYAAAAGGSGGNNTSTNNTSSGLGDWTSLIGPAISGLGSYFGQQQSNQASADAIKLAIGASRPYNVNIPGFGQSQFNPDTRTAGLTPDQQMSLFQQYGAGLAGQGYNALQGSQNPFGAQGYGQVSPQLAQQFLGNNGAINQTGNNYLNAGNQFLNQASNFNVQGQEAQNLARLRASAQFGESQAQQNNLESQFGRGILASTAGGYQTHGLNQALQNADIQRQGLAHSMALGDQSGYLQNAIGASNSGNGYLNQMFGNALNLFGAGQGVNQQQFNQNFGLYNQGQANNLGVGSYLTSLLGLGGNLGSLSSGAAGTAAGIAANNGQNSGNALAGFFNNLGSSVNWGKVFGS